MDAIHLLMRFGLTHQEAKLYAALHGSGEATGYEAAKETGISRSNSYAGLASLVEKGAARLIDGKPARYAPVPVEEYCANAVRGLQEAAVRLRQEMPRPREQEEGYLTIRGERHIRDKIATMIAGSRYRIYLSMGADLLEGFLPALEELAGQGRKVVVITDRAVDLPGGTVHLTGEQPGHIRIISDSAAALTGTLDCSGDCTCLFSRKENLVELLKDSIKNEIALIALSGGGRSWGAAPHPAQGDNPLENP